MVRSTGFISAIRVIKAFPEAILVLFPLDNLKTGKTGSNRRNYVVPAQCFSKMQYIKVRGLRNQTFKYLKLPCEQCGRTPDKRPHLFFLLSGKVRRAFSY